MAVNVGWRVNDLGEITLTKGVTELTEGVTKHPVCPGADLSPLEIYSRNMLKQHTQQKC